MKVELIYLDIAYILRNWFIMRATPGSGVTQNHLRN